jgi:hypothetical protein
LDAIGAGLYFQDLGLGEHGGGTESGTTTV